MAMNLSRKRSTDTGSSWMESIHKNLSALLESTQVSLELSICLLEKGLITKEEYEHLEVCKCRLAH